MGAFLSQFRLGLKLALRNRMALIYGFVFPLIFLLAFWALYRHDEKPLILRLGELLTVTVLGGACFGLPTTLVSERERGVWRRYRLTPTPTWIFISSVLATRYVLILAGALMQIAVAMLLGMPPPSHLLGLWVAFTLTAFAFMGLGMVIATLADNVPTVQALGQCIFLPMLIVGGVAVRLSTLPEWAMHVSAFFPGRYAVASLQASASGGGLGEHGFDLLALALIGGAAFFAALQTFRWDAGPARGRTKPWVLLSFAVWALVGVMAEVQHRIAATEPVLENVAKSSDFVRPKTVAAPALQAPTAAQAPAAQPPAAQPAVSAPTAPAAQPAASSAPAPAPQAAPAPPAAAPKTTPAAAPPAAAPAASAPASWRDVTPANFKEIAFERLPPDSGVIAPIAAASEEPDPAAIGRLTKVNDSLPLWIPGLVSDKEQAVRNMLYVAGAPDLLQMDDVERFIPVLVLDRLRERMSDADLEKIFYWIAMNPEGGSDDAIDQLGQLGLPNGTKPRRAVRERTMLYAFKFLGRLTGATAPGDRPGSAP